MQRIRIVALGDSTTAGTPGFQSPLEAPPSGRGDETSQYAYWLMRAHPDWDVLNRGVNGERSDQIAARLARDVIGLAPAAVVIIAGVNDVYQGRAVEHVTAAAAHDVRPGRARRHPRRRWHHRSLQHGDRRPERADAQINAWIRAQVHADPAVAFVDTRAAVAAAGQPGPAGRIA